MSGGGTVRTEYAERYITMGLKIAYYRKKAGYTQEVFAEKIGKSVNFMSQVEGTGTVRGVSWKHSSKSQMFLTFLPLSCWKMIKR